MDLTVADVVLTVVIGILGSVIASLISAYMLHSGRWVTALVALIVALIAMSVYVKAQILPAQTKEGPGSSAIAPGAGGGGAPAEKAVNEPPGSALLDRPGVSVAQLIKAAKLDPDREQGKGTPGCTASVERFENALAVLGFLNRKWVDGSYGTATFAAVKGFQESINDTPDGVPGILELRSIAARSGTFIAEP